MNFQKLCNDSLKLNSKIRFAGILKPQGGFIAYANRNDSTLLLSDGELKMLVYYISDRWKKLQNLQHKLGTVKESITKFENLTTITLFLDRNPLLVSLSTNSNTSKISSDLRKLIEKNTSKKKVTKRKLTKKPTKKKVTKRKLTKKPTKKKTK